MNEQNTASQAETTKTETANAGKPFPEFVKSGGIGRSIVTGVHLTGYGVGSIAGAVVKVPVSLVTGLVKGFVGQLVG